MKSRRVVLVAALVAAVAVPVALAQVQDRYRVASDPDARGYSRALAVVFDSPPEYVRDFVGRLGNDGHWKGPRYQATGNASLGGESTLDWGADVDRKAGTRAALVAELTHGWPVIDEGTEPIEHRVGGRLAGTIPARWILTQGTPMAGEARYEAGVAIPLCGRTAFVDIAALLPSGDSAGGAMGFGEYRMADGSAPTDWNRRQVTATIAAIGLDGSLPAARITAARRGSNIVGRVTDCNRHAVAGLAVRVERRIGRAWRVAARARTRADGSYTVRATGNGPFRVVSGSKRSAGIR